MDLAADLRRWLDGRPITARRIGILGRARRLVARNRALSAAVGAAVLVAVIGGLIASDLREGKTEAEGKLSDVEKDKKRLDYEKRMEALTALRDRALAAYREDDPTRAMLLFAKALEQAPPEETAFRLELRTQIAACADEVWALAPEPLTEIPARAATPNNEAVGPNGRTVVVAVDRLTVRDNGQPVASGKPPFAVWRAGIADDGSVLATDRESVAVLDPITFKQVKEPLIKGGDADFTFSTKGQVLTTVTGSDGKRVAQVWQLPGREPIGAPVDVRVLAARQRHVEVQNYEVGAARGDPFQRVVIITEKGSAFSFEKGNAWFG